MLIRNEEVFRRWKRLGLNYMFLGLEALDEEGLTAFRKRTTPSVNNKALEVARSIGLSVAINIIADPDWDEAHFAFVRQWAMSVPEIVNITVQTPYPGTETWLTESRRLTTLDYRLFDVQHAVLPTRLPLHRFYSELVKTQAVLARKHLGAAALAKTTGIVARQLLRGQTNFAKMIWKFDKVYNADRQYSEHLQPVEYQLPPPAEHPVTMPDPRRALCPSPAATEVVTDGRSSPGWPDAYRWQRSAHGPGDLAGLRAVITGGSSGIGAATARAFAARGSQVAIAGRNLPALKRVAADHERSVPAGRLE